MPVVSYVLRIYCEPGETASLPPLIGLIAPHSDATHLPWLSMLRRSGFPFALVLTVILVS